MTVLVKYIGGIKLNLFYQELPSTDTSQWSGCGKNDVFQL